MPVATTKLESFKMGDTPTFSTDLDTQVTGFSWSGITYDAALTAIQAPSDNTGAIAVRTNQNLTVYTDGTANASLTLSQIEAAKLTAGTTYHYEIQLRQGALTSTVYTATVTTLQDYVK